jgi:DNA-binding winged helix-turn-helix (wHTH) protein/tetratricopeptide (TPR) repeat protein
MCSERRDVLTVPRSFSESFSKSFVFGPFRLDMGEGVLRRSGKPVDLVPKAVELLAVLVAARGGVVRKETLLETVWTGTFVEENTLSKYVSFLRKAFGSRHWIETVSRRGYRFTAPVTEISARASPSDAEVRSVALIPFDSPDAKLAYIGEGLTERLISRLSRLRGLKVMGSTTVFRYRKRPADPRRIARELQVEAVLCGRLTRQGRTLALQAELCDGSGTRLWGERYERSPAEVAGWDADLARDLAAALAPAGAAADGGTSPPPDVPTEAYHLYLKGQYNYNKRTQAAMFKAAEYFRRALSLDPRFALAHVGLGSAYSALSWVWVGTMSPAEVRPVIEAAAARALELDPTVPEAHVLHGNLLVWHEWKWREAETAFRRALELNPQCVLARQIFGFFLSVVGRLEEAEALLSSALELDPLSSVIGMNRAWVSYVGGRYDEAVRRCEETLELEPGFGPIHVVLALSHERKGAFKEAIAELDRALGHLGTNTTISCIRAHMLGKLGRREEARIALEEIEKLAKVRYVSSVDLAIGYAGLGDGERVFSWLRAACDERSFGLVLLKCLPFFDAVRSERRFAELSRRVGLSA